eukprot:10352818-Lingulodinium_polyedra.AAC.1
MPAASRQGGVFLVRFSRRLVGMLRCSRRIARDAHGYVRVQELQRNVRQSERPSITRALLTSEHAGMP